jgi:hypothetical protein
LAAVRAPPQAPHRRSGNLHDVADNDDFDEDDGYDDDRLQDAERRAATTEPARRDQKLEDIANKSNNNTGESSPKKPQRQRRCLLVVAVAVLIAVATVAGICGTGRCSPSTADPVRSATILSYINGITISGRRLTYPSRSSAEERAVQWLIDDDLGTDMADELTLRQRYVLGTLWFLQTTPTIGFGSVDYAATWTTNIDECKWAAVDCDASGRVTALNLGANNVRGQIPNDFGLLTDLTNLQLWGNQLSGTIPSSLVALTALRSLFLFNNRLVGTMPFCNSDQALGELEVDCAEVNCTCCTGCCPTAFGNIPASEACGNTNE